LQLSHSVPRRLRRLAGVSLVRLPPVDVAITPLEGVLAVPSGRLSLVGLRGGLGMPEAPPAQPA
jgi:hypothetical protein